MNFLKCKSFYMRGKKKYFLFLCSITILSAKVVLSSAIPCKFFYLIGRTHRLKCPSSKAAKFSFRVDEQVG